MKKTERKAVMEAILTVIIIIELENYAQAELNMIGFLKGGKQA